MKNMRNNILKRLIKRKILQRIFSDAIEWQESLVDAHTLLSWHQTKELTKQANYHVANIKKYRKFWKQLLNAVGEKQND